MHRVMTDVLLIVLLMANVLLLLSMLDKNVNTKRKLRKRKKDSELPFHSKRKRVLWPRLVRSLGPTEFEKHHRVSFDLFNKLHSKLEPHISTNVKYARKTCCRGKVSHVDSRSRLSMTLKHLAGSKTQDIQHTHGVSRSTVVEAIASTFDAIITEFGIPKFPFDNEQELMKLADGFKKKSTGDLFTNVVGAFDGYLLRISKRCIGSKSGVKDPSKYYCRKGFYAINCQVSCDANRRITSLSMLSPGAVPDRLAHLKGSMHRSIETGCLPQKYHFVGDNAYPSSNQMLTPCTRQQLRDDIHGWKDNYNFYLSQLRINIECCFGMLINKFPILQAALLTPKLGTACKTFMVCCILHNLCIDERLARCDDGVVSFPTRQRLAQTDEASSNTQLTEGDFELVDTVDETTTEELQNLRENVGPQNVDRDVDTLSVREKMIRMIAAKGYVRPKIRS